MPTGADIILDLKAPAFVTVTEVTPSPDAPREFVLSNEATGRYFLTDLASTHFFTSLRDGASVATAARDAGIDSNAAGRLIDNFVKHGLMVRAGQTNAEHHSPKAPIEGKLVMTRWDLLDVSRAVEHLGGLGRLLYNPVAYAIWLVAMFTMAITLIANRDKVVLTLQQAFDANATQWIVFAGLFIGLKAVHEFGHALAYQSMCRQERLDPGPIRMGICIFAFSPFPFTDVTGAWRLRSTWRRVMIGGGGIYFETWAMALLTLFWAHTQTGLIQTVVLQVAVVSGALAILFNLNPAVKLDGYFMLTDAIRRPNLSIRASQAARTVFARALGASLPKADRLDLGYWVVSYAYRWVIFAGIFWLAYQFDPRLGYAAVAIVCMLLVIRPLMNAFRFASASGIHPLRTGIVAGGCAALGIMAMVPLPDRLLINGHLLRQNSTYVDVTHPGRLTEQDGQLVVISRELEHRLNDANLRLEILKNLRRGALSSAEEQARLDEEVAAVSHSVKALMADMGNMQVTPTSGAVWTPMDAPRMIGTWVRPGTHNRLGALSTNSPARIELLLPQSTLRRDLPTNVVSTVQVRNVSDPNCSFYAETIITQDALVSRDGQLTVTATPHDNAASCANDMPHGGAVVARLELPHKSLVAHARLALARLLQDRLPIPAQT